MHINRFIQLLYIFLLITSCSQLSMDSQSNSEIAAPIGSKQDQYIGNLDNFEEFKALIENEDTKLGTIEEFLDGVDDLQDFYEYGEDRCNFIHYAADQGEIEIVNLLIDRGVAIDVKSELERTVLHFAVGKGYIELASKLIEKEPSLLYIQDHDGNTPLHLAIISRYFTLAMLLSEKYEDNEKLCLRDTYGYTVLHLAAAEGACELVLKLLEKNPKLIDMQNEDKDTALHIAVLEDRLAVVESLLAQRANHHLENSDKCTALDLAKDPELATQANNKEIITMLERQDAEQKFEHK